MKFKCVLPSKLFLFLLTNYASNSIMKILFYLIPVGILSTLKQVLLRYKILNVSKLSWNIFIQIQNSLEKREDGRR